MPSLDYTLIDETNRASNPPATYPTVWTWRNNGDRAVDIWLEMIPERVFVAPGQSLELLARQIDGVLPLDISETETGLQIHASYVADPDWHIRFNGHLIKPSCNTRLSDFDALDGNVSAMRT